MDAGPRVRRISLRSRSFNVSPSAGRFSHRRLA
jgi:hypothetical protein